MNQLPAHLGKIRSAVTITSKEYTNNPQVTCNYCDHSLATRSAAVPPASQIKNEKRCGLGHAKGDKLVYCHEVSGMDVRKAN